MGNLTTTPKTWVAGEVVTSTQMNDEIRDKFTGLQAAWTDYPCTWSQADGSTLLIGNGTLISRYIQIGKTVHCSIVLTRGSTTNAGTTGNYYRWSLPVAAARFQTIGAGAYFRGGGPMSAHVGLVNGTLAYLMQSFSTTGARLSADVPGAWAVGDWMSLNLTYEAA